MMEPPNPRELVDKKCYYLLVIDSIYMSEHKSDDLHTTLKSKEKPLFHGDTLSVYAKILGLRERRYPKIDEFPEELDFPTEFLGSFFEDIEETKIDNRERARAVSWDEKENITVTGRLATGIGNMVLDIDSVGRSFFGNKALLFYHTHPIPILIYDAKEGDPSWYKDFSIIDIARMRSFPRNAFITGLGSNLGGVFAMQTDSSSQLPFSVIDRYLGSLYGQTFGPILSEMIKLKKDRLRGKGLLTEAEEKEVLKNAINRSKLTQGGDYLQNKGYGGYVWTPQNSFNWVRPPKTIPLVRFDVFKLTTKS